VLTRLLGGRSGRMRKGIPVNGGRVVADELQGDKRQSQEYGDSEDLQARAPKEPPHKRTQQCHPDNWPDLCHASPP